MKRIVVLLPLLLAAVAMPAAAQINPFRSARNNPLTNDDYRAIGGAVDKLLAAPALPVGAHEAWQNPATRASGTVTNTRNFRQKGLVCHALRYVARPRGNASSVTSTLNWCHTPDGWKIV